MRRSKDYFGPIIESIVRSLCFLFGFLTGLAVPIPGLGVLGSAPILLGVVFCMVWLSNSHKVEFDEPFKNSMILGSISSMLIITGLLLSYFFAPQASMERLLVTSFSYLFVILILPFLVLNIVSDYWRQILCGYVVGILALTIISLITYLLFLDFGYQHDWIRSNGRLQMWMGPNSISKHIVIGTLIICFLNLFYLKQPILSILIVASGSLIVVLTGSNSGLLINLVCIGLFVFLFYKKNFIVLYGAFVGLLFLFKFLPAFINIVNPFWAEIVEKNVNRYDWMISGDISKVSTYELRLKLLVDSWSQIKSHPIIGVGPGMNSIIVDGVNYKVHNTALLLWSEGGILAFLGLVVWGAALVSMAFSTDRYSRRLILILAIMVLAYWMTRTHAYQVWTIAPLFFLAARSKWLATEIISKETIQN